MSAADQYHAIIIGSGQGATPLAAALASAGWRTALIEREHIGGTCVNEGCTPSKTMIASARAAYFARRGPEYGVNAGDISIDMQRVRQRKRDIVTRFRTGSQKRLEKTPNLELMCGKASFSSAKSVLVRMKDGSQRRLSADKIFIDAGTSPAVPALDGLKDVPFLNSTSIMELDTVPDHLIILGDGYVALEFAQTFRRFGSRVTIVGSSAQLLANEDSDVAQEIASILQQDGIEILLNAKAQRVSQSGAQIKLTVRSNDQSSTLEGSHFLVATGRVPNIATLNLPAAGIETDSRGFIKVNGKLETSVKNIYAIGDIKGGPAFTHISYDDFRVLRTNLLENGNATTEGRLVPYTIFMDPQLGRIGLTEKQAYAQHKTIRVAKMPMSHVARALETDETRGFMKAIVDAGTNQILGAAILGVEGGEIMAMVQLAMMGKLPYTALRDAIFAHPTPPSPSPSTISSPTSCSTGTLAVSRRAPPKMQSQNSLGAFSIGV